MSNLENLISSRKIFIPEDSQRFKDIYRHFRGKTVGELEGDARPLFEKPEEFYLKPPLNNGFLQGDILSGIAPVWVDHAGDPMAGNVRWSMVLSNECDTELRTEGSQSYIRLCPIYEEDELLNLDGISEVKKKSYLGNIRANNYTEYFWMPLLQDKARVADIGHSFSMDLVGLHDQVTKKKVVRVASLSLDAYCLLTLKMAWSLLRPVPDSRRSGLTPLID